MHKIWLISLWFLSGASLFGAELGKGTHLYLRCNATTWDVSDLSRLKPAAPSFLRELSFEVKDQWMIDNGDDCVITETPQLNGWGDWQKYYGGQVPLLLAPESARVRIAEQPGENLNFKIRYPSLGRYRFILNTRDGYFSVRKDTTPRAGDVSWTLPGNMLSDNFQHLFLSNYYPENSLSLVDPATGLPRWTYTADNYISFYSNCSTADTAFLTLTGRVIAISLSTGRELWSSDLDGALEGAYAYLTCYPGSDQLYLSYGSDRTTLVALNKSNGKVRWSWAAEAYAGLMGADADHVFISSYQDTRTTLRALDKISGRQIWKSSPDEGYYSLSEDGSLYLISGARVSGVSPATGRSLWTYQGKEGDALWLSFEQNRLYLHEKSRVSLLESRTGRFVWSYDFSRYQDLYPYAQVLKAGIVLIRVNDYNAGISRQIALKNTDGQTLWEREESTMAGYLNEDEQGGAWLFQGKSLSAIDPSTGTKRWTFTLPSDQPWENIMNIVERDGGKVYVSYGYVGSKYPPMGIMALDANNGRLLWQTWMNSSVYRVGGDSQTLILNAGYFGSTKALKK